MIAKPTRAAFGATRVTFSPAGRMTFQHALLLRVWIVFAKPAGPALGGFLS
jgi:hypothetical protein